jgi:hypothetical protein
MVRLSTHRSQRISQRVLTGAITSCGSRVAPVAGGQQ